MGELDGATEVMGFGMLTIVGRSICPSGRSEVDPNG